MFGQQWFFFWSLSGFSFGVLPVPSVTRDINPSTARLVNAVLPDKDPDEAVTFSINLRPYLKGVRTIDAVTFGSPGDGLEFSNVGYTPNSVQATISGGANGCVYTISARVTLTNGDRIEPWARLRVKGEGF